MMIVLIMNHDDPDHDEDSRECKNVLEFARNPVTLLVPFRKGASKVGKGVSGYNL